MNRKDIDTLWQKAMQESVKAGELFTRYHFADLVADAEAKRIHNEGMVTVGHMREQVAAETEACAKVAENMDAMVLALLNVTRQPIAIAAAIRARKTQ